MNVVGGWKITLSSVSKKQFSGHRVQKIGKKLTLKTPVQAYQLTEDLKKLSVGAGAESLGNLEAVVNDRAQEMKKGVVAPTTTVSTFVIKLPKIGGVRDAHNVLACLNRFIWNSCVEWQKNGVIVFEGKLAHIDVQKFPIL